jgi:hypothetical protein
MNDSESNPSDIYEWVTPSNPIEMHITPGELVPLLEGDIDALEKLLQEGLGEAERSEIGLLVERRREMIRWAQSHDGAALIGVYPGFERPEVSRERGRESEDQHVRSHIVFWRLRQALADDHAYWAQFDAVDKTAYGHDLWTGFQKWADAAYEATATLRYSPDLEEMPLHDGSAIPVERSSWRSMLTADVTFPLLSLRMAERAYDMTAQAAFRCKDLITLVVRERPPADVASFLERVAQLYLWGFDSEVYALGRSVLDAALKQRLPDDVVRQLQHDPAGPRRYPDMRDRIRAAVAKGLLTRDQGVQADHIRKDGNDVIHEFPNANLHHASPLYLIRTLTRLLRSLLDTTRER